MNISGIAYVELVVANLKMSAFYYQHAMGFSCYSPVEEASPCGDLDLLLVQGDIRILLRSPTRKTSPLNDFLQTHGDGTRTIAFLVNDLRAAEEAIESFQLAGVDGSNTEDHGLSLVPNVRHRFYEDLSALESRFSIELSRPCKADDLQSVDHVAICVRQGRVSTFADAYQQLLGFRLSHEETVDTGNSGMYSKALATPSADFSLVLVEPLSCYTDSHVETFIKYYQGQGIQHLAYRTDNIIKVVQRMRQLGVGFLSTPKTYYDNLANRLGGNGVDFVREISEAGVLFAEDVQGEMLQVFSKPLQTQPTCFFELIERRGCMGFGSENIKALFKAIESEHEDYR